MRRSGESLKLLISSNEGGGKWRNLYLRLLKFMTKRFRIILRRHIKTECRGRATDASEDVLSQDTRRGWGFINVFARKLLITFLGLGVHCEKSGGLAGSSLLQASVLITGLLPIRLPISRRVRPHSTGGTASRSDSVTAPSTNTDTDTDTNRDGDRATVTVTASVIAG